MKNRNTVYGALAGSVAGIAYFYAQEAGVPKESNAQYLAPVSTDVLAWGFGGIMVYKAFKYNDPLLSFVGAAIIAIHGAQFAAHKVIKNRILTKE